ncbi:MAG: DNA polymerase III subunit beta [Alphaproteobacteria bacterium]|nr:DNA polymerase III subunit beta [Alphaproteobacteria bacterium]
MKFTIERSTLLKTLAHVQSVVERRNTIPILANVRIEANDESGTIRLTATDMDLTIDEQVAADISAGGVTTAPAHMFFDIVRKLPDGAQVEVTGLEGRLTIISGRSEFSLNCLPPEDFPSQGDGDLPHRFTIESVALRSLIDRTRFAISTEETRYYLNGIYLHAAKDESGASVLRAVATDGHRLARVELELPDGAADIPGVIVPRKTVAELRKLADETAAGIEIGLSETRILMSFDNITLTSKLIDGTFPDYERVIPADNDKHLSVDCRAFEAAVDRVSTISTEKSRAIKLNAAQNVLTLSATSAETSSANEELEVDYDKDPLEIGFNARYLLDITQQIQGEAELVMADAASPTILRDAGDASALYVLMPMRV